MGKTTKSRRDAALKAEIAVEAAKGEKTITQLVSEYGVHPNQIGQWKKKLLEELPVIFSDKRVYRAKDREELKAELYRQIGQLKVELEWLKKVPEITTKEKRALIEAGLIEIPLSKQCELLGLSRSGYYYQPQGETELNLQLMNLIDMQYTKMPVYGIDKMTAWLRKSGYPVNPKRIRRLMRKMGLAAIYPKPNLSVSSVEHKKYPYLLRDLAIAQPDQVWSADITYIRMARGFLYLVAIMDWHSRYVLSWRLSNTLDVGFCLTALEAALAISQSDIFNSDQGVQLTSREFTDRLEGCGIRVSMDSRGRAFDNIFIERLWRSVKYEAVYVKNYESVRDAVAGLTR